MIPKYTKHTAYSVIYNWFVTRKSPQARIQGSVGGLRVVLAGGVVAKCVVGCLIPDVDYRPEMEVLDDECGINLDPLTKDMTILESTVLHLFLKQLVDDHEAYSGEPGPKFTAYMKRRLKIAKAIYL